MRKDNAILVDYSWLYNRYYYMITGKLAYKEPLVTEIKAETLRAIREFLIRVIDSYPDYKILCCLDSPKATLKNKFLFEDYKAGRKKNEDLKEGLTKSVSVLAKLFNNKIAFVYATSYEADQVIAVLVEQYFEGDKIIHSGDKDLLQLTAIPSVSYSDKFEKGRFILKTDDEIFAKFVNSKKEDFRRISENKRDIVKYRALRGDISDNIPPIYHRISDKTIINIIKNYWIEDCTEFTQTDADSLAVAMSDLKEKDADKFASSTKELVRNFKLMNLFGLKGLIIERVKVEQD